MLVVAVVAAAGAVASRVRNEDLFLANLGYGRARVVSLAAVLPALLEVGVAALTRA